MTTTRARTGRLGALLAMVLLTLAALVTATTPAASAATVEECQGQLSALPKPKVDPAVATTLSATAAEAAACIQSIS